MYYVIFIFYRFTFELKPKKHFISLSFGMTLLHLTAAYFKSARSKDL